MCKYVGRGGKKRGVFLEIKTLIWPFIPLLDWLYCCSTKNCLHFDITIRSKVELLSACLQPLNVRTNGNNIKRIDVGISKLFYFGVSSRRLIAKRGTGCALQSVVNALVM